MTESAIDRNALHNTLTVSSYSVVTLLRKPQHTIPTYFMSLADKDPCRRSHLFGIYSSVFEGLRIVSLPQITSPLLELSLVVGSFTARSTSIYLSLHDPRKRCRTRAFGGIAPSRVL